MHAHGHLLLLSSIALALCGCPKQLPDDLGDCAGGTDLGWADAGPIFAAYCTECHHSALTTEEERQGAEPDRNFDTPDAAREGAFLTWSMIYTERMPKDGDTVLYEDALVLWEWLSCGGPE